MNQDELVQAQYSLAKLTGQTNQIHTLADNLKAAFATVDTMEQVPDYIQNGAFQDRAGRDFAVQTVFGKIEARFELVKFIGPYGPSLQGRYSFYLGSPDDEKVVPFFELRFDRQGETVPQIAALVNVSYHSMYVRQVRNQLLALVVFKATEALPLVE